MDPVPRGLRRHPCIGQKIRTKTVNVTIRRPVHKYMHIYDQCNFWATIFPSTCVVISDLLSVSCATLARKNLIGWCKQRDFFSRRIGARFMSISKPFYQHSGTIYWRPKSYLVVRISSDTVAENYGQVWLQFAMAACVFFPLRPLAMLWHARGPEAATHDSWPAPQCCWNCVNILNFGHQLSTKHSLLMQTEAVVHCQIQRQTITCNAELLLSNHRYIATWTLDGKISGKIWGDHLGSYLHLKNVGSDKP